MKEDGLDEGPAWHILAFGLALIFMILGTALLGTWITRDRPVFNVQGPEYECELKELME